MQLRFSGFDFGIFVLGREILKQNSPVNIIFDLSDSDVFLLEMNKNKFDEKYFWKKDILEIQKYLKIKFSKKNKFTENFDKIGIFYDHKNYEVEDFFENNFILENTDSEKGVCNMPLQKIKMFPYKILKNFAEEGLADSVEFRRLARKFLRIAKSHNCKALYFPEIIFGDEKTQQILQHLAGSQMKIFTVKDFFVLPENKDSKESAENNSRKLEIIFDSKKIKLETLKPLCEQFLKTKISDSSFLEK